MGVDVVLIAEIIGVAWIVCTLIIGVMWWRMSGRMLAAWDRMEIQAEDIKADIGARRAKFRDAERQPTRRFKL